MQAEHGNDIVPPSTRSLNYIALRYSEFPPEIMVSDYSLALLFFLPEIQIKINKSQSVLDQLDMLL